LATWNSSIRHGFILRDVDRLHLQAGNFHAFRVDVGIDLAADFQSGFCGRRADQLDNDLVADQRLATPVHGDAGEQSQRAMRGLERINVRADPPVEREGRRRQASERDTPLTVSPG
jgi:hypothetical protein